MPPETLAHPGTGEVSWMRGLDIVIGYKVSWILMFADYSRYTRSAGKGALAAFLGLALTSLWLMPLGLTAARAAGSSDPGAMLAAVNLEREGAALLILATLTTNFVNIYLSALAWKSLFPGASQGRIVWAIGIVGAALSLLSGVWLERFAGFMLLLGGILVPVGGVLLARFFLVRREVDVPALYQKRPGLGARPPNVLLRAGDSLAASGMLDKPLVRRSSATPPRGLSALPLSLRPRRARDGHYSDRPLADFSPAGLAAWALGAAVYYLAAPIGATLPSLATAVGAYWLLDRAIGLTKPRVAA